MEDYLEGTISEKEIKQLLGLPTQTFFGIAKLIIKYFLVFALVFSFIFGLVNGPAIWQKIRYFWKTEYQSQPYGQIPAKPSTQRGQQVYLPEIANLPQTSQVSVADIKIEDNHILIPKINVDAPIVWQVSEQDIIKSLRNGVVHYKGTALPGQVGNIFITGHSSNYWWDKGQYNQVFALLEKMVVGDVIIISYKNTKYVYKVRNVFVVKPKDLSVLNPTATPTLTLVTCVPVGTTLNRLVVQADQIWPAAPEVSPPVLDLPFLTP